MPGRIETPRWKGGALACCGFTERGEPGPEALACARQVHGDRVHVVSGPPAPEEGDGLWTAAPGLHVAVRVADCVPILLWDPGVPAVAAVHAGWRGAALDVPGAAVQAGVAALGVEPGRLWAALGPAIGPCCFEVGDDVVTALLCAGVQRSALGLREGRRGRPHLDLRSACRALLVRAGLRDERIEDVGSCTCCDPDRYESFRRDGAASGRMRGVIALALLCLALLASACGPPPSPTDEEVARQAEEIRLALEDGDASRAEELLRPLLAARPDDAWLRASLGRALHRRGRFLEAAVQSRMALGADPAMWEAAYDLACHHAAMGEADLAIGWLQEALAVGALPPEQVVADPDLAQLRQDHRFAFYASTGALPRQEEDAMALLRQPSVSAGEPASVTLIAVALNRPLMARREPVEVRLRALPSGPILPVSRTEAFSAGSEGGSEHLQRTFDYAFVPLEPGPLAIGPFELVQEGRSLFAGAVLLDVQPGTVPGAAPALPGIADAREFFRAPALDDPRLAVLHEARGGRVEDLDPHGGAPAGSPWAADSSGSSRHFRFRALTIDALPAAVPEMEPGVFRSTFLCRGTQGWSHVIETRPAATPLSAVPEGLEPPAE